MRRKGSEIQYKTAMEPLHNLNPLQITSSDLDYLERLIKKTQKKNSFSLPGALQADLNPPRIPLI